jgi:hypothetical protein
MGCRPGGLQADPGVDVLTAQYLFAERPELLRRVLSGAGIVSKDELDHHLLFPGHLPGHEAVPLVCDAHWVQGVEEFLHLAAHMHRPDAAVLAHVWQQGLHGVLHAHDSVLGELGRLDEELLALPIKVELESPTVPRREDSLGR